MGKAEKDILEAALADFERGRALGQTMTALEQIGANPWLPIGMLAGSATAPGKGLRTEEVELSSGSGNRGPSANAGADRRW